ncbi:hypothetical protein Leryth_016547 [Lithospermum erythrorhizon]|nr:hypothetical protein Leryth_016547 [Lithospermum erythrorhizon]
MSVRAHRTELQIELCEPNIAFRYPAAPKSHKQHRRFIEGHTEYKLVEDFMTLTSALAFIHTLEGSRDSLRLSC